MKIERFEDIEGWRLGRELTQAVYRHASTGNFARDFGLRDQVESLAVPEFPDPLQQRAAGSVMHNIAEGFDGGSNAEFVKFLRYAQRSASEVQSQLYVALDQGYIQPDTFNDIYELAARTKAKIGGFIAYLLKNKKS